MPQTARDGATLKRQLMKQYALSSANALALCDVAAKALDMALAAEKILAREGLTINGTGHGLKAHPAVAIARDSRNRLMVALRDLDLET